jgi:nucleoside phosphorylase
LTAFDVVDNLTNETHIRFAAKPPNKKFDLLLVEQSTMGRTACQEAANNCLIEFDCGILICIGIAGGLSLDLNIGDICYSGSIIDVLDNAKIKDGPLTKQDLLLSPVHYSSPRDLTIPISLDRINPLTKAAYTAWASELEASGKMLIPGSFHGKGNKLETISRPNVREGAIACGLVSASPEYNAKLMAIDRKILAIETESGGLFAAALQHGVPAMTIRGISDYAGVEKNAFEQETGNKARLLAITNATSFLVRQLESAELLRYLDKLRLKRANNHSQLPLPQIGPEDSAASVLVEQGERFNDKLRDLAPAYSLQSKGYRLPVPRIRTINLGFDAPGSKLKQPIEVRDALRDTRVITLHVPREYPDLSLSWIMANDLLSGQLGESHLVPCVVEAKNLQRPRFGIAQLVDSRPLALTKSSEFVGVFIIDDFNFDSKSRSEFLLSQIELWPDAKFVIVTRSGENAVLAQEFTSKLAASTARLCDVSFTEIASFIQKNFEMQPSASEVVAVRLCETFHKYALPAHPSYFAGIPRNTLNALLQANRRAELIELAVAGYLSFVVADDKEPIALSRTTREKFLGELVFCMSAEKRTFTEAELTAYAEVFAKKYDFKISSSRFISLFIEKRILHVEGTAVRFTLPFMEAYLLAKRLTENASEATKYFSDLSKHFDYRTFTLYAEMGATPAIIKRIMEDLDSVVTSLNSEAVEDSSLMDATLFPPLLARPDRLRLIQAQLQSAAADVRADRDQSKEKQKILDMSDQMREIAAARASANQSDNSSHKDGTLRAVENAASVWSIAISLLGSGAERLEAGTKRDLIKKIVKLSGLIIDNWTRVHQAVDFEDIKKMMLQDNNMADNLSVSGPGAGAGLKKTKATVANIADLIQFVHMLQPFLVVMVYLCEEARDHVLAESIVNTTVDEGIDELVRSLWLSDIDVPKGKRDLVRSIKGLPKARLLRHAIMTHLMGRVFWKHWRKEDRLSLLDAADLSLKGVGLQTKTGELKRIIERLPETKSLDE